MLDEYVLSLDPLFFTRRYDAFWVRTVIELMVLLGPEADTAMDSIIDMLLAYHDGKAISDSEIDAIPSEIVRLRGPGFWRDNSALGLKYRCVNAIAASAKRNDADPDDWQYGILTALQFINLDHKKDQAIIERISIGLEGCRGTVD